MKPRRKEPKVVRPRTPEKPKKSFCILRLEERIAPSKGGNQGNGGGGLGNGGM
jgi:hypothetical protein